MVLKPLTNFPFGSKENTHSPKQATKCKVYFYQFFLKVLNWTLEMRLWQPWANIFAGKPMFPLDSRKLSSNYFCFRKFFLKMFICTSRLRFWDSCLTVMLKVQVFSTQSPKLFEENIFSRLVYPILFSPHNDRWFDTPDQRILQQRQINHSNSKNDNRKTKLFRKTNHFSSRPFSGIANSCFEKPEEIFLTKSPFFHLEVRRSLQSCSFLKKTVFPQKFLKVRSLQFWQPCR